MIRKRPPRVLLASMPWAKLAEPSLGLSILKAVLSREGVQSRTRHFNIEMLQYLKSSSYAGIADINALNEFLFTNILEPAISAKQLIALYNTVGGLRPKKSILSDVCNSQSQFIDYFLTIRNEIVPKYLAACADYIEAQQCSLLGFTCMYDQTFASIALAEMVKSRMPNVMVVFGGYALEGPAGFEILKRFNCIDAVAIGDGEPAILGLARASVGEIGLEDVPNIAFRGGGNITQTARTRVEMVMSPEPDFTDFLEDVRELETAHSVRITPGVLPMETSRGCWWGQKSHCVFCGIDEETLKYRQRPPGQVIDLIDSISSKYPGKTLRIVDYILPNTYFATVLPKLAAKQPGPRLTCEVKSNLTAERIALLRAAGFVEIQPGIESFSTEVLRRMRKGVTGIQNILTLKVGKARGLRIDWNLLYGFPDDRPEDYEEMIRTIPHLYHLDPPFSHTDVFVTRFAPLQANPSAFNLRQPTRHRIYDVLLSEEYVKRTGLDLDNICYFFESQWQPTEPLRRLYKIIDAQIEHWKHAADVHPGARLTHCAHEDHVDFHDHRLLREEELIRSYPIEFMAVYSPIHQTVLRIDDVLGRASRIGRARASDALEQMMEDRIIFREGDRAFGLSLTDVRGEQPTSGFDEELTASRVTHGQLNIQQVGGEFNIV